eukprot:SAG31_NODE_1013_length_10376_cov_9.342220_9_plen_300_part_00
MGKSAHRDKCSQRIGSALLPCRGAPSSFIRSAAPRCPHTGLRRCPGHSTKGAGGATDASEEVRISTPNPARQLYCFPVSSAGYIVFLCPALDTLYCFPARSLAPAAKFSCLSFTLSGLPKAKESVQHSHCSKLSTAAVSAGFCQVRGPSTPQSAEGGPPTTPPRDTPERSIDAVQLSKKEQMAVAAKKADASNFRPKTEDFVVSAEDHSRAIALLGGAEVVTTDKSAQNTKQYEKIRELFNSIDADGSGKLDKGEIKQLLKMMGDRMSESQVGLLLCPATIRAQLEWYNGPGLCSIVFE